MRPRISGKPHVCRPRQELYGTSDPRPVNRFADEGKGDIIALVQKNQAAEEVAIVCTLETRAVPFSFGRSPCIWFRLRRIQRPGLSGHGGRADRLFGKMFNVRDGFDRKDDTLPQRMFTEPLLNAGDATGQVIRKMDILLDEYYQAFGYNERVFPPRRNWTNWD